MEHPENDPQYAGLQVNSGVTGQTIVNPYLKRNRFRRRELSGRLSRSSRVSIPSTRPVPRR